MTPRVFFTAMAVAALTTGCITPIEDYHGYTADEIHPREVQPGTDSRASVLAQLGSPSTESVFDENTWIYMTTQRERVAFFRPEVVARTVIAIRFDENDLVEEVVEYDQTAGRVINYASRETPTRGRELGFWEQIFGTVGAVRLPQSDERTPDNPTGRR
ncbi:MAG: outer membrane protein assembly factor BamE [Pseudomonadota bacterium]